MLNIVQAPDPVLREVCEPCDLKDKNLKRLAKQMAHAMYKNNGCGLAAPQIGRNIRLVVIDVDQEEDERDPLVLVNPVIMELRGEPVAEEEGCLSVPGISVPIARQPWARVRFFDLDGEEWEIEGDGLLGRCLQHEIDHLDGKTLLETCDAEIRLDVLRAYDEARAAGARPGDVSV